MVIEVSIRLVFTLLIAIIAWFSFRTRLVRMSVIGAVASGLIATCLINNSQIAAVVLVVGPTLGVLVGAGFDSYERYGRIKTRLIENRFAREYECPECGRRFRSVQSIGQCPSCQSIFCLETRSAYSRQLN